MNHSTRLARRLVAPSLLLLAMFGMNAQADSHGAPPPPGILEVWLCNYQEGKDMDDLMAVRDFYLEQAERAGITPAPAYVWSLLKGDGPNEVLWFNVHESLEAFGAASDEAAASPEMTQVLERFETVTNCQSTNIATFQTMFEREVEPEPDDDSVVVSSSVCRLNHGWNDEDVADLMRHINNELSNMGDNAPMAAYMANPMTGGSQMPMDRVVFNVNDDMASWTSFVNTIVGTAGGQQLARHFNKVFSCTSSLWSAQQVVGGDG